MSNVFNFNRLCALIRRQWINVGRIYLMSAVIITGIFIAFYVIRISLNYEDLKTNEQVMAGVLTFRQPVFYLLGLFFITIISSSYFSDLGQKTKAIFELMIPASRLEKFLSALFYTVFVSISAYIILFFLVDLAFVSYLKGFATAKSFTTETLASGEQVQRNNLLYFFQLSKFSSLHYFYFLPILLNGVFLLGSIAYQNYQYIKTAISMIVYVAIWMLTFGYVMKLTTDNTIGVEGNNFFQKDDYTFQIFLVVGIILSLIFLGLAFLKLKEKEV